MPDTPVAHFAINADDVPRARAFYEAVFGWEFTPFGPPGFFQIETGSRAPFGRVQGALQERREALMEPTTIPDVGELVFVRDSEGNVVGAMRYVEHHA